LNTTGKIRPSLTRGKREPASWPYWCACRKPLISFILLTISFASGPAIQCQANSPGEYQLKAAFLFNFAKFVDWPPGAFPTAASPFVVCILGQDPFGTDLDDALRGKTIADRSIVIRRCQSDADARGCQIVFVSRMERRRISEILQGLRGVNVLLVGESEGFAAGGGAIEFVLDQDRIRFRINPGAASRAGLTISSKLLALATIVHDGSNNGKS
jgi:hypothetical protein